MRTLPEAIQWVRDHPTRKGVGPYRIGYGWSWSQLCVALVYNALGATHTFGNANLARSASHIVSTSKTIPAGAFAWFDYGKYGHVAFSDGTSLIMASRFTNSIAKALGRMTATQYENASGATYRGYSWDFGGQKFAGLTTSSTGTAHVLTPPTIKKEDEIMRFKTKNLYVTDLFTIVEAISQAEAEALNDGSGGTQFEPVTSEHAQLIIAGVKRRRLAALAGANASVLAAVSAGFDSLSANEVGFTATDVADELAKRLAR